MTKRWFILPVITEQDITGQEIEKPKYVSQVERYSGNLYDLTDWDAVPLTGKYYIAKLRAPDSVLNDIESEKDAYTRQEYGISEDKIADVLNKEFGKNLSFSEWGQRFEA